MSQKQRLPIFESEAQLKREAWVQLARTFLLVQRRLTTLLSVHSLTLPQFDVLATLRFSDGCTQQELAARLLVTKGNVCGVLDRMERAGWVARRPDAADRRANRLHLTPAGRSKIDRALPQHDAVVERLLQELSKSETQVLCGMLSRIDAAAEAE